MPSLTIAQTDRLNIRYLCGLDLSKLAEMLADPEVMRFSVNGVMTREATQDFLDWCFQLYSDKGYGPWAVEDRNTLEFLGFAGLTPEVRNGHEEIHIGYRFARKHWRRGIATEATRKVLEYGFKILGLDSIFCAVMPDHLDSIKVAEKIGFSSYEIAETHGIVVRMYRLTSSGWIKQDE